MRHTVYNSLYVIANFGLLYQHQTSIKPQSKVKTIKILTMIGMQ